MAKTEKAVGERICRNEGLAFYVLMISLALLMLVIQTIGEFGWISTLEISWDLTNSTNLWWFIMSMLILGLVLWFLFRFVNKCPVEQRKSNKKK